MAFDDSQDIDTDRFFITSIDIRWDKVINSIQVNYVDSSGTKQRAAKRGGDKGNHNVFNLQKGEHIIRVEGKCGSRIDSLQFFTNQGI